MKPELQLSLSAFDPFTIPICGDRPVSNGFRRLCYHCPFTNKRMNKLICTRFQKTIPHRTKYSLPAWKKVRASILERDQHACVICQSGRWLHVHHLDHDPANDNLENLITLCDHCHALFHVRNVSWSPHKAGTIHEIEQNVQSDE